MRFLVSTALVLTIVGAAASPEAPDQPRSQTPATAGNEPPQTPQPTFRGGVNLVNVDVVVSDRSARPVTDLTQADFEILEDGEVQPVEQFKLVTVDGRVRPGAPEPREIRSFGDEETELARDDVRTFVIFLDDYHVTRAMAMRARQRLVPFIKSQIGPNDIIAIMHPLTPVSALTFTRSQDFIVDALNRFEGRADDLFARNPAEAAYAFGPPGDVRAIRRQVVLSALQGLAVRLGSVREGRKSVLYVSEGFAAGAVARGSLLDDVLTAANRHNVAFYPIDPRGLTTGSLANLRRTRDLMSLLAEETGGRATIGRNSFEHGLSDMVRDSSSYYLLGYTTRAGNDGKFHDIRVRVKRKDVDVRARKGYWALSPEDALRAAAPPTPEVDPTIVATLGSIERGAARQGYGKTWVGTSRGDAGRTRVLVVWESSVPAGDGGAAAAARMSVSASDASGASLFRGQAENTAGSPGSRSLAFDVAPGTLDLRIGLEGPDGAILDSERQRLQVPDLTQDVALSTPRVFRGRTAREVSALRDDAASVPLATREFSRTERLLIKFDVYNGSDQSPPRAMLINRRGQRLTALPVAAAGAGGTHHIELGLGFVASGDYVVEVAAGDVSKEVKALLAFRVVG
jgi:VWFA-related protein